MTPTRRPLVPGWARRALPLRAYFAALFVVCLLAAIAGAFYVDRALERDARAAATRSALHSAETAGEQLEQPRRPAQGHRCGSWRRTPRSRPSSPSPRVARSPSRASAGPTAGHLDIIRADGTVACSSSKLTPAATRTGYAGQHWLADALAKPAVPRARARRARRSDGRDRLRSDSGRQGRRRRVRRSRRARPAPGRAVRRRPPDGLPDHRAPTDARSISRSHQPERWIGTQARGRPVRRPPRRREARPATA